MLAVAIIYPLTTGAAFHCLQRMRLAAARRLVCYTLISLVMMAMLCCLIVRHS
eukprot:EC714680.1.p3 GENE.EC714680.1~~EC714680.1.p3  ORF type:complete len:53 (-),score=1.44 EC714680.1:10-168(-)